MHGARRLTPPGQIDVIGARATVAGMGVDHLQDQRIEGCKAEPLGNLIAQHSARRGNGAVVVANLALARHHQHQPTAIGMGGDDEPGEGRMCPIEGHPVQVELALGAELPPLQPVERLVIHADRLRRQTLLQRRAEVMTLGMVQAFDAADVEIRKR